MPLESGELGGMSRKSASREYEHLMAQKSYRIDQLRKLLAANDIELTETLDGVRALEQWYVANVEPDPTGRFVMASIWYSVANDIALFLGDLLIQMRPHLRWDLYTWDKKNISYQRPVVMGFKVPNPRYNVDFNRVVALYGRSIVENDDDMGPDLFVQMLTDKE